MKETLKFNEIEALLPVYVKDMGNCTEIIAKDECFIKSATIETCIKNLADYYNISLYHNRINYGKELDITNKVPIVINENLIYVYVNVREPIFRHDAAYGFVDINSVKEVFMKDGYAAILMNSGNTIQTRQSIKAVKRSILNGRLARDIYKEKHKLS